MTKVVAIMSMSLDGYVADLNDGVAEVFDWYFTSGSVEIHTGGSDRMTFKVAATARKFAAGVSGPRECSVIKVNAQTVSSAEIRID